MKSSKAEQTPLFQYVSLAELDSVAGGDYDAAACAQDTGTATAGGFLLGAMLAGPTAPTPMGVAFGAVGAATGDFLVGAFDGNCQHDDATYDPAMAVPGEGLPSYDPGNDPGSGWYDSSGSY